MMKLTNLLNEVLQEAETLNTYGDLKKLLQIVFKKQKGAAILSKGKEVAIDAVFSAVPGLSAAKTAYDFFKAASQKPDTKKTNTWIDNLDIDDDVAAIVDDTVEDGFMQALAAAIDKEPDDKELEPDFNINVKLQDYLKGEYNNRTVTMS
jgi:hypothetical protein